MCWSLLVPGEAASPGRAHSPLPRDQASGCTLLWPVQCWGTLWVLLESGPEGALAFSQMPWGDCDDDGDAHVTVGQ